MQSGGENARVMRRIPVRTYEMKGYRQLVFLSAFTLLLMPSAQAWRLVDGTANQITDDNWVLKIAAQSDGTYSLNDYVSGEGELDLSRLEADTGITISRTDRYSFYQCDTLTSVILPESCTVITRDSFKQSTNLVSVTLSPVTKSIGEYAFYQCTALTTVTPFLPETVKTIDGGAFREARALTGDLKLNCPELTALPGHAFQETQITSADMSGSGITSIGQYAFYENGVLESVLLPPKLVKMDRAVFFSCSSLRHVSPFLPKTVTTLSYEVFRDTAVTNDLELLNHGLATIPNHAFNGVDSQKVTIHQGPVTIGNWSFFSIGAGTEFYYLGTAPTLDSQVANSRLRFYACRIMDKEGWAALTTELTDADKANTAYPGRGTFGVCVNNGQRHWLIDWKSPLSSGPFAIRIQ